MERTGDFYSMWDSVRPRWTTRWAPALVCAVLAAVVAAGTFIPSPETVTAAGIITAAPSPRPVTARSAGEAILLAQPGQSVAPGEVVGYVESTVRFEDARHVGELVRGGCSAGAPETLRLGELTGAYNDWRTACRRSETLRRKTSDAARLAAMREQLAAFEAVANRLEARGNQALSDQEFAQAFPAFEEPKNDSRDSSNRDYDVEMQIVAIRARILDMKVAMAELSDRMTAERAEAAAIAGQAADRLMSELAAWDRNSVLRAPIAGQVVFRQAPGERHATPGEEILTIVPAPRQIISRVVLPQARSAAVRPGCAAVIKVARYPYTEYGSISGRVATVASAPAEKGILVEIALPNGLRTQAGKTLEYMPYLDCTVDIITKQRSMTRRILDRVFNPRREDAGA